MDEHVFAVLMAGGSGTRFWPLSRRKKPKQVLPLAGGKPMVRATLDRLRGLVPPERVLVVTGADQVEAISKALGGRVPRKNFLAEPAPRNTAPCIGLAAVAALARDAGALLLCLPADHVVSPETAFRETARRALRRADEAGTLLTFAVAPTRPATGYGYLRLGEATAPGVRRLERFVEKPDIVMAKVFLAEGVFRWNSGMFAFRADAFLAEVTRFLPDLARGLTEIGASRKRLAQVFPRLPAISVDYGVMEKTDRAEAVLADFAWDDVGSFEAAARLFPEEPAELLAIDSHGLVVRAPKSHVVAALGVRDLVIVVTRDATLVCARDRTEEVKRVVEELKRRGRTEHL